MVHLGGPDGSRLLLPTVPAGDGSRQVPGFKTTPAGLVTVGAGGDDPPIWRVTEDVLAGTVTVSTYEGGETVSADGGTALFSSEAFEMTARDEDPADARMQSDVVYRLRDGETLIDVTADGVVRGTAAEFRIDVRLRVALDGEPFFERSWSEAIPRRLV
jgi:hypothetical protein